MWRSESKNNSVLSKPLLDGMHDPLRISQYAAWLILVIFTTALIAIHSKLESPLVSGDEYMYFSNAREFPHNLDYPTLSHVNNILYLGLGKFW
jgi:hypothetical protein